MHQFEVDTCGYPSSHMRLRGLLGPSVSSTSTIPTPFPSESSEGEQGGMSTITGNCVAHDPGYCRTLPELEWKASTGPTQPVCAVECQEFVGNLKGPEGTKDPEECEAAGQEVVRASPPGVEYG
jgi:hypothetical protein